MRLSLPWFAIALAFLGSAGPARGAEANASLTPVETARLWLEAVRDRDFEGARRLSTLPFTVKGFNLESGPDAVACGGKPRADGIVGVYSFDPRGGSELVVSDEPGFEKAFRCLTSDNMLLGAIPPSTVIGWPRDRKDARDGNVGEIRLLKDSRLARRLRRYRNEIKQLPKTDFAVQVRMTDNNGVTNHVLFVIAPAAKEVNLKVRAVYIDELFEE
jgi:hypothetical protein